MSRQIRDAFAERQAIGLNGATAAKGGGETRSRGEIGEGAGARGGEAVLLHEPLRECFGGLEPGGFLVWAPDAQTVFVEQVHDAQGQGVVRPDDGEVGAVFPGKGLKGGQVFRAKADALDEGAVLCEAFLCDARVAGGAPEAGDVGGLRQLPNQGVLAAARANDQNLHRRDSIRNWHGPPKEFASPCGEGRITRRPSPGQSSQGRGGTRPYRQRWGSPGALQNCNIPAGHLAGFV